MTSEQLEEIKKLAEADMAEPWSEAESAYVMALQRYALPLVKALEEAWEALDQVSSDDRMSEAQITATIRHEQAQKEEAIRQRDEARAEVERLREVMRQVHALAEKTMLDAWCVGIGREKLREIHKLTKGMVE